MTDAVSQDGRHPHAEDLASYGESGFDQLHSLFTAIKRDVEPHTHAYQLAQIGEYLTEVWSTDMRDEVARITNRAPQGDNAETRQA